jgi:hypothetical protein
MVSQSSFSPSINSIFAIQGPSPQSTTLSRTSTPIEIETMSNPNDQQRGAAQNQRTWSTTATNGSGSSQSNSTMGNARVTDASTGNTVPETPYSVQRWLAEKPYEGPWNGLMSSKWSDGQASKRS